MAMKEGNRNRLHIRAMAAAFVLALSVAGSAGGGVFLADDAVISLEKTDEKDQSFILDDAGERQPEEETGSDGLSDLIVEEDAGTGEVSGPDDGSKPEETKPEETKSDDKNKGGSAVNVNDPSEETTTETTTEQATETTTEAPKNNTTTGGDNKSNTEVPARGTTNVEEPKKAESSKPAETPKKEEAPRSSSSVRTGDGTLFAVVIVVMAVSFLAIVGIVMYKRKHDNE